MHRKAIALVVVLVAAAAFGATRLFAGPDKHGAHEVRFTVKSRLFGRLLEEVAAVPGGDAPRPRPPGGGRGRPLLVFLHGRGGHPGDFFSAEFYAELARLGTRAPIVVQLDGGDHSYWHDRRSGRWGGYVLREAIPQAVRVLGADPSRIAIGGISMGGYGAFDLARRKRFCAVGGHSPAFWLSGGQSAPGAFDDAADFARHDVYAYARGRRRPYGAARLWIDRGDRDPFAPADREVVRALRASGAKVSSHVWPGEHETEYWRAHTARYLRFYAGALAHCGQG
jgi:poly(3-hydroxybutyrate) depolymerase